MFKLLTPFICFLLLFSSCSSDETTSDTTETTDTTEAPDITETPETPDTPDTVVEALDPLDNSITLDGEEFVFTQTDLRRSEDEFVLILTNATGESISMKFHKNSNYGDFIYLKLGEGGESSPPDVFKILDVYPDRDFSFEVLNIDTTNNRVSIILDGIIHEDDDFDSDTPLEQIEVSGSLNLPYETVTPSIEGLEVSATIGNEIWYSLDSYASESLGVGPSIITFTHSNNTSFRISLVLNKEAIVPGTYTFTQSSDGVNRLFLSKSIVEGDELSTVNYLCSGTLVIDSYEVVDFGIPGFGFGILNAQFSFTATHPDTNEEVNVTSGMFNIAID